MVSKVNTALGELSKVQEDNGLQRNMIENNEYLSKTRIKTSPV